MTEETNVLSLEAQSLSAKVSAALQRGLNAAADDLVAARRKSKRADGGAAAGTAAAGTAGKRGENEEGEEEDGESVYGLSSDGSAELAAQQHQQRGEECFPASASASAPAPAPGSTSAPAPAAGSSKASDSSRLERLSFKGGRSGGGGRGG